MSWSNKYLCKILKLKSMRSVLLISLPCSNSIRGQDVAVDGCKCSCIILKLGPETAALVRAEIIDAPTLSWSGGEIEGLGGWAEQMCLHYSKARLIATRVEAEGVKINTSTLFWSERLESERGKQMQIHHSGVKVKILEVEVKPEKWMHHHPSV